MSMNMPSEPQFMTTASSSMGAGGNIGGDSSPKMSSASTMNNTPNFVDSSSTVGGGSTTIGIEPMGELDGAINNLAMSAKYNLTQMSPREFLKARWSTMQSWGSFIDTSRMVLPVSIQQWSKRLVENLKHFQSNYFGLVLILCLYSIFTSPLLLLVMAAIVGAGYILTLKNAERPLKLFGRKLNLGQQYAALGLCSLPLLYLVGAGSVVFWVIGASLFVITLHASVYDIEGAAAAGGGAGPRSPIEQFTFGVQSV